MSDEKTNLVTKQAVPVLPCGHEASFEHELVDGLLALANDCSALGIMPIDPLMDYVRQVFAYFYLQVPTFEEMQQIALSHKLNDNKTQEVN